MIYSVDVRITAPVNDTELADRVERAVTEIFPTADVERTDDRIVATTHDLDAFAEKLRDQRILDTARSVFHHRRRPDGFEFELKKQAAFVGVVNFSVGNPDELGDVHVEVTVREPDVETFVDYLAPATDEEGVPAEDPFREDG